MVKNGSSDLDFIKIFANVPALLCRHLSLSTMSISSLLCLCTQPTLSVMPISTIPTIPTYSAMTTQL